MADIDKHVDYSKFETERIATFTTLENAENTFKDENAGFYKQCTGEPEFTELGINTTLSAVVHLTYTVHVYDGPHGKGCILTAEKTIDDELWQYRKHIGPESRSETFDTWKKIEESNLGK